MIKNLYEDCFFLVVVILWFFIFGLGWMNLMIYKQFILFINYLQLLVFRFRSWQEFFILFFYNRGYSIRLFQFIYVFLRDLKDYFRWFFFCWICIYFVFYGIFCWKVSLRRNFFGEILVFFVLLIVIVYFFVFIFDFVEKYGQMLVFFLKKYVNEQEDQKLQFFFVNFIDVVYSFLKSLRGREYFEIVGKN